LYDWNRTSRSDFWLEATANQMAAIKGSQEKPMGHAPTLIDRVVRKFVPRSKERYFSSGKWDDSWSKGYDLNTAHEDARYGTLMALMRRHERGGPLLDVGCRDGLLEERYRQLSDVRIVAFDYSATAIERANARRLAGVDFKCADSRTIRLEQQFSQIVLNESLYYVDDYIGLLATLATALRSDGVIVISMYETRTTRAMWKKVLQFYAPVQGFILKNESTNGTWHIRVVAHPQNATAHRAR
jgi:2-polyprenyl-3-methyl-5-hydroxy-6-metoxy-1,4-benzoquinol methylase